MTSKLVISGLSDDERRRFNDLCVRVEGMIPEAARRGFDNSTVARLAIREMLASYETSPEALASALGFRITP